MPRKSRQSKTFKEIETELNQLNEENKVLSEREGTLKNDLNEADKEIEGLKREIIELKKERTIKIAEYDAALKNKKNELLKTQKLRRSILYEYGKIKEKHEGVLRSITRRNNELEERKKKFLEKIKGEEAPTIIPPSGLESLGGLEIRDNNGDGN